MTDKPLIIRTSEDNLRRKLEESRKLTRRDFYIEPHAVPNILSEDIIRIRNQFNLSRPLFARCLRVNVRTLENWEQGRAQPNAQAVLLLRMVERYPDTMQRLSDLD